MTIDALSAGVFHPRPDYVEPYLVVDVGAAFLGCHDWRPHPDAGHVVFFHGNGELASECLRWGDGGFFHGLGVNVCFVGYRGYGRSTGVPALDAMRGDGERVVGALGVDPARVVAFGRSLGSLYAVELAHRLPEIAGLIIDSGIADIVEQWPALGPLRSEADAAFDTRAKMAGYRGRVLVMHAEEDRLVPRSHADRLHAWAGSADKRLVVFPFGGHNTIWAANRDGYLLELEEFLTRCGVRPAGGLSR